MIMKLEGLGRLNEGDKGKNSGKPYKMQDAHFVGTSIKVQGKTVARVTLNYQEDGDSLPEMILGGTYMVDLSDKGFINDLQLVEKPTTPASQQGQRNVKLNAEQ